MTFTFTLVGAISRFAIGERIAANHARRGRDDAKGGLLSRNWDADIIVNSTYNIGVEGFIICFGSGTNSVYGLMRQAGANYGVIVTYIRRVAHVKFLSAR